MTGMTAPTASAMEFCAPVVRRSWDGGRRVCLALSGWTHRRRRVRSSHGVYDIRCVSLRRTGRVGPQSEGRSPALTHVSSSSSSLCAVSVDPTPPRRGCGSQSNITPPKRNIFAP